MGDAAFLTDFHHVATIGATDNNGVERQAATEADKATRDWFAAFARSRNWEVRVDGIGNMFALIDLVPGAPYILLGSHLDSQPLGGRFDGAYGVLAGLHAAERVAERLADAGTTPVFNLAVVNWFNEEGGRFAPSIMGSSVFAGLMDQDAHARGQGPRRDHGGAGAGRHRLPGHRRAPGNCRLRGDPHRAGPDPGTRGHHPRRRRLLLVHPEAGHRGARRTVPHRRHGHGRPPRRAGRRLQGGAAGPRRHGEVRRGSPGLLGGAADPGTQLADRGGPPRAPGCRPALGLPADRRRRAGLAAGRHRANRQGPRHPHQRQRLRRPRHPVLPARMGWN